MNASAYQLVDDGVMNVYSCGVFLVPAGWGELLTFIAQPIHLPIGMVACAMTFFVWRSLRHSR